MTNSVWKVNPIDFTKGSSTETCRQLYQSALDWTVFADKTYEVWAQKPDCGYFLGGSYWYGLETAHASMVYAALAVIRRRIYHIEDEKTADLLHKAICGIRYLAFTHDTGPADCVRVESNNPHCSKTKWGGKNDNFFQASQHGVTIAGYGFGAWLIWDELDDETKIMVQQVLASYADRWSAENPHSGVYYDTQCEENAWTSMGIAIAANMFSEHPHLAQWRAGQKKWAVNSLVTPADIMARREPGLTNVTLHPDYTTENHAMVHPDYMAAGIILRGVACLYETMRGEQPSSWNTFNWEPLYRKTIQAWCGLDGAPLYIQGQDWWYNRQPSFIQVNAFMHAYTENPVAFAYLQKAIDYTVRVQKSNRDNSYFVSKDSECRLNPFQTMRDMEAPNAAAHVINAFFVLFFSPKPETSAEPDEDGIYHYRSGGSILKRSNRSIAAFTFRNSILAFTMGRNGMWTNTTAFNSYIGTVSSGTETDAKILELQDYNITQYDAGFGAVGTVSRLGGKLTQEIGFVALPDDATLYLERITARQTMDCDVRTGLIGVRNERYEQVGEQAKGYRDICFDGRKIRFEGYLRDGEPDEVFNAENVSSVNLDDEMGYLLSGSRGVRYVNNHFFPSYKGIENSLILNCGEKVHLNAGESLPPFAVLTVPNCTGQALAGHTLRPVRTAEEDMTAYFADDRLVYANFAFCARPLTVTCRLERGEAPIFNGETELCGSEYLYRGSAERRCSGWLESPVTAKWCGSPKLRLLLVNGSRLTVQNEEAQEVRLQLVSRVTGGTTELTLAAGGQQTVTL